MSGPRLSTARDVEAAIESVYSLHRIASNQPKTEIGKVVDPHGGPGRWGDLLRHLRLLLPLRDAALAWAPHLMKGPPYDRDCLMTYAELHHQVRRLAEEVER